MQCLHYSAAEESGQQTQVSQDPSKPKTKVYICPFVCAYIRRDGFKTPAGGTTVLVPGRP